ncbi:Acetolactate synthase, mitochondrial [Sphaceloma murrayae]|uniref:Acetolactate synthase, mitochondrial n=1 Tax=Sphaceloma murrayae TaxID=2082308 RepID=A0A2K1QI99_9PEZI|nr:Acetolactate synthase, mitochondrial [Sphaceloma murrayae]
MPPNQDEVDAMNAAVDRMRKFIPEQPYIQSIPQDEPRWHHRNWEQAQAWRKDAPFDADEKADLQYQTFYYHEHGANLIHLGVHDIASTQQNDSMSSSETTKSVAATPKLGPKKKISLADYKNQKVNTPKSIPASKKETANGVKKHEVERKPAKNTAKPDLPDSSTRDFARPASPPLKRKRSPDPSDIVESTEVVRRKTENRQDDSRRSDRADRKAHLPASPDATRKRDNEKKIDSFQLPAPISPLRPPMPDRLSPIGIVLPDRLSPTLPDKIVRDLDRRERVRTQSNTSKSSSGSTSNMIKHDSVLSNRDGVAEESKKRKRDTAEDTSEQEANAEVKIKKEMAEERRASLSSLIFKIKIPKARRQDYSRLLRFPPRPSIRPSQDIEDDYSQPVDKAQEDQPEGSTKRRKSPRSPSPIRKRKPADTHKSPLQAPFQSPPLPSKDIKPLTTPSSKRPTSHAMSRIPSTDSHIPSPLAPTPTSTTSHGPTTSHLKPSPSRHTPLSQSWQSEADRLLVLAKALKKTSQALLSSSSRPDNEIGALTSIESFAGFMLAFHASDRVAQTQNQSRPVGYAPHTWGTMHALWRFTWDVTARWPPLRGLVRALGMVYLGRVYVWCEGARGEEKDKMLAEAGRNMAMMAGGRGLDLREVRERWPGVWERLIRGKRGLEGVGAPGEYEGTVEWPLGVGTEVVRAVRTVVDMLGEWKGEKRFVATLKLAKGK